MTANPHRGEVSVTLDGREYKLRPTFQALVEIEQATGCGLVELTRRFIDGKHSMRDIASILVAGINAGREPGAPPVRFEQIGPWAYEAGFLRVTEPCLQLLNNGLTGGGHPSGE